MNSVLFVGRSWSGSCARSLREALQRVDGLRVHEVSEDLHLHSPRSLPLRILNRLTLRLQITEFQTAILKELEESNVRTAIFYKCSAIASEFICLLRSRGVFTVNVYPDCSPHAFGAAHAAAIGSYDLVISTKPFHPPNWQAIYRYKNPCRFVAQGYDPSLHYRSTFPAQQPRDVVLVATWRPEYERLLRGIANDSRVRNLKVAIAGNGWSRASQLPAHWEILPGVHGHQYVDFLRSGKVCLAPVTREISVNGITHPGDEDSTRTYELPAAYTFFIHKRTEYVQSLFDERTEVPLYDSELDLAEKIVRYLPENELRHKFATAAHLKALEKFSLDLRAREVLAAISDEQEANARQTAPRRDSE